MSPEQINPSDKMNSNYLAGYQQADNDNSTARAALLEAIAEARREAANAADAGTRARWNQKVKRWQANLAHTRALALTRTMQANDAGALRVILWSEVTGAEQWRGTLAEFVADNPGMEESADDIAIALRDVGAHIFDMGAGGIFRLTRDDSGVAP